MDICRTLGSRSLSVTAMLRNVDFFSGKMNNVTAIHGLGEDDTARPWPAMLHFTLCKKHWTLDLIKHLNYSTVQVNSTWLQDWRYYSNETLTQRCFNVRAYTATLVQHWTSIWEAYKVWGKSPWKYMLWVSSFEIQTQCTAKSFGGIINS